MLYVAYGSNLNREQMEYRVPGAKPYGNGFIHNWKLDFHGNDGSAYATITRATGHKVPVVLWEMSDKQETVMDRYEGFPNSYYKRNIAVYINGRKKFGTVYIMNNSRRVARPSRKYVNTIRRGYEAFGLDLEYLEDALIRNSQDFYLDDLLEVRDFKVFTKKSGGKKSKKKGKKSSKSKTYSMPVEHFDSYYTDINGKRIITTDPYYGPTYSYDDDYGSARHNSSWKPSLDDYDAQQFNFYKGVN